VLSDILRARTFAIACGYEDADDLGRLRFDPALTDGNGRPALGVRVRLSPGGVTNKSG